MPDRIARQFDFLVESDRLKSVDRANVLMDLSRPENSAEHSWHVALQAMVFGASDRVIQMLLLHLQLPQIPAQTCQLLSLWYRW